MNLVIVPTYNEAQNIAPLIRRVMALDGFHLLIVDDGSPDGTAGHVKVMMQEFPTRLFILERSGKLGLGTAYIAGFNWALARAYTVICEMDADFSHNPNDLPRLVSPIVENQADLVIGSRYKKGVRTVDWPLSRLMLSYGASLYTRLITLMPIWDATAGFKAYHRKVLENIDLTRVKSNGYSFQIEMKFKAWKQKFRLLEIPIVFVERSEGKSKMNKAIIREAVWKVVELRLRSLLGKL